MFLESQHARGTQVRYFCEDYLNNDLEKVEEQKKGRFLSYCLFSQLKPVLDEKIGLIYCQESALWSDKYRLVGRVDCIAEYDDEIAVIDFKTSTKERRWLGMKTIIYKHLHILRCFMKEQVYK